MEIRAVDIHAVEDFKSTRLRALQDSPTAFGSTYQKESLLTDADWRQRVLERDGTRSITFLAWDGLQPCGIAAGFVDQHDAVIAHIVSVWVAPTQRRSGVGRELILAVVKWAASRNVTDLALSVTSSNQTAIRFYRTMGFKMTGETQQYPNDSNLIELTMAASPCDVH